MNETGQATTFDEWIGQASVDDLHRELFEKEHALNSIVDRLQEMDKEAQQLHEEIVRRRRVLEVLVEIQESGAPSAENASGASAAGPKMSKRQIAERILAESLKPLAPKEVRAIAVERGWLEDTAAAGNQLSVAMNKAARQNKLMRDEEGRYSLPPNDPAAEDDDPGPLFDPDDGGDDRP